ncbi:hypothetical protein ACHAXH_002573 [Discostella pseudostelligera]
MNGRIESSPYLWYSGSRMGVVCSVCDERNPFIELVKTMNSRGLTSSIKHGIICGVRIRVPTRHIKSYRRCCYIFVVLSSLAY